MMKFEVRAQSSPWMQSVDLLIRSGNQVAEHLVMRNVEPGASRGPSLSIAPDAAQTLMDDLWHCGFRPTDGTGSVGQLAATERHLEDMRRLVFGKRGGA
jgi:hypothetical protein